MGETIGLQPGLAILSFWQGVLEIMLRLFAPQAGGLPALIAAAVALGTGQNSELDNLRKMNSPFTSSLDDLVELRDSTYAATGYVIAIAVLAIVIEVAVIAVRFLNIGFINANIKIFLIIDTIVSVLLVVAYFTGGVVLATYSGDWSDYDDFTINNEDISGDADTIQRSMIASAVFCFIAMGLFVALAVYMMFFMIMGWNDKMAQTRKEYGAI